MMMRNRPVIEIHYERDDVKVDIVTLRPFSKKELAAVAELLGPHFTPSQGKPSHQHVNGTKGVYYGKTTKTF